MPITKTGESLLTPVDHTINTLTEKGRTKLQQLKELAESATNPQDRSKLHRASLNFLPGVRFAAAATAEALEAPKTIYKTLEDQLL